MPLCVVVVEAEAREKMMFQKASESAGDEL